MRSCIAFFELASGATRHFHAGSAKFPDKDSMFFAEPETDNNRRALPWSGIVETVIPQERNSDSIAIAVASPPPMQIEATPFRALLVCIAPSSVTMMRAPDAPIG